MEHVETDKLRRGFRAGGEMEELILSFDWASTPVGPIEDWPESLRTTITILLSSKYPMFLWWGPELIQFYNDGYRPSLGSGKHPTALGQRGRECWPEIWPIIGPQIEQVQQFGKSVWYEDSLVPIYRNNRLEEVYWTYTYSPVSDDDGNIGGILVVVNESTDRVAGHRRLQSLSDLATTMRGAKSASEVCLKSAKLLHETAKDLSFFSLYLFMRRIQPRFGSVGIRRRVRPMISLIISG